MTDVVVTLKNGQTFCGPLWEWRPQRGWFVLVLDERFETPNPENKFYLKDVASAIQKNVQVRQNVFEDVDLVARAWKDGWDGR